MTDEKKPSTLNDIAKALGVNKATVSKAISGKGTLSAQTRERILKFISDCGYRPNAVAQSLARSRTNNIGVVMPGETNVFDMAFFRDCLEGACQAASAAGYDVIVTMSAGMEQLRRLVENRKIDGMLVLRSLIHSDVVDYLKKNQVPFALVGGSSDPEILSVDNNNLAACQEMTARLIAAGNRRMALLGGNENNFVTGTRLSGFLEACAQAGLSETDQQICLNLETEGEAAAAVERALDTGVPCIICMDDAICNMALVYLRSRGCRVPEQVQLVSFYDSVLMERNVPSVTSIRFDAVSLGRTACGKLIRVLAGQPETNEVLPDFSICMRASTRQ